MHPGERLHDERHRRCAAAAEDDRADRDALRVVVEAREARVVRRRSGEARVRVRGLLRRLRRPGIALPVDELGRHRTVLALPPDVAVRRARHVREDRVAHDRLHGVRVRLVARARRHAEVAVLRVDGVEAAVLTDAHPRDVVTDGPDLPALEALGRDHHREVRLAAGARERRRHVRHLALGALDAEDEHVLREPAFLLAEVAADAEREALLPEEDVAAVAGADGPDRVVLREVADEAALRVAVERGVQAAVEVVRVAEHVERDATHAGHDPHVEHDVDAVGQLDADLRHLRAGRSHDVRHDVHRAALHRAVEELAELGVGLAGRHPVVGGAGLVLCRRADERELLDARDVVRVRAVQVAAGELLLVQRLDDLLRDGLVRQPLLLGLAAVAPDDPVRLRERGHLRDPLEQLIVLGKWFARRILWEGGDAHSGVFTAAFAVVHPPSKLCSTCGEFSLPSVGDTQKCGASARARGELSV